MVNPDVRKYKQEIPENYFGSNLSKFTVSGKIPIKTDNRSGKILDLISKL
jgi:hypothetical protein